MVTYFRRREHQRTNSRGTTFDVKSHDVFLKFSVTFNKKGEKLVDGKFKLFKDLCRDCYREVFSITLTGNRKVLFDNDQNPLQKHSCSIVSEKNKIKGTLKKPKKLYEGQDLVAKRRWESIVSEKQKKKVKKVKSSIPNADTLLKQSLKSIDKEINQMKLKIKDELDKQKLVPILVDIKKLKIKRFGLKIKIETLRSRNTHINSRGRKKIKNQIGQYSKEQKNLLKIIEDLKDPKSEYLRRLLTKGKKATSKSSEIETKKNSEKMSMIDEEIKTIQTTDKLDGINDIERDKRNLKLERLRLEKLKLMRNNSGAEQGKNLSDTIRKKASLIINLSRKIEEGLKTSPTERIRNEIKKVKISLKTLKRKKQNNRLIELIAKKLSELKELEKKLEGLNKIN